MPTTLSRAIVVPVRLCHLRNRAASSAPKCVWNAFSTRVWSSVVTPPVEVVIDAGKLSHDNFVSVITEAALRSIGSFAKPRGALPAQLFSPHAHAVTHFEHHAPRVKLPPKGTELSPNRRRESVFRTPSQQQKKLSPSRSSVFATPEKLSSTTPYQSLPASQSDSTIGTVQNRRRESVVRTPSQQQKSPHSESKLDVSPLTSVQQRRQSVALGTELSPNRRRESVVRTPSQQQKNSRTQSLFFSRQANNESPWTSALQSRQSVALGTELSPNRRRESVFRTPSQQQDSKELKATSSQASLIATAAAAAAAAQFDTPDDDSPLEAVNELDYVEASVFSSSAHAEPEDSDSWSLLHVGLPDLSSDQISDLTDLTKLDAPNSEDGASALEELRQTYRHRFRAAARAILASQLKIGEYDYLAESGTGSSKSSSVMATPRMSSSQEAPCWSSRSSRSKQNPELPHTFASSQQHLPSPSGQGSAQFLLAEPPAASNEESADSGSTNTRLAPRDSCMPLRATDFVASNKALHRFADCVKSHLMTVTEKLSRQSVLLLAGAAHPVVNQQESPDGSSSAKGPLSIPEDTGNGTAKWFGGPTAKMSSERLQQLVENLDTCTILEKQEAIMEEGASLLYKQCHAFELLDLRSLKELFKTVQAKVYLKGINICSKGFHHGDMLIVSSGLAKGFIHEYKEVEVPPGTVIAEFVLGFNQPRKIDFHVQACKRTTCLAISNTAFSLILLRQMMQESVGRIPGLGQIEPVMQARVASHMDFKCYEKGDLIIDQGKIIDQHDHFYIIISGRVMVSRAADEDGAILNPIGEPKRQEFLGELGKGETFGEAALLMNGQQNKQHEWENMRNARICASTKVELATISKSAYNEVINAISRLRSQRSLVDAAQKLRHLLQIPPMRRTAENLEELVKLMRPLEIHKHVGQSSMRDTCRVLEYLAVPANFPLFKQGEPGDCYYVVMSGQVRVTQTRGNKTIDIGRLGPGTEFGQMALLNGQTRSATAVTDTVTEFATLDRRNYLRILKREHAKLQMVFSTFVLQVPLLEILGVSAISKMYGMFQKTTFGKGRVMVKAGEEPTEIYVICEGTAEVLTDPRQGARPCEWEELFAVSRRGLVGARWSPRAAESPSVRATTSLEDLLYAKCSG
ncbi:hypothetical protein CYMTET_5678 [Cymbomonas tetramitiformis]|uniref:Cyclic nucleotide-binding domain-containing protein n=1 Tax=Cymbomonas tetramitiformis TaxID=36881 RepID=A0AAE0GYZ4_9CHLO|nr:hypothetical protein CYMTET_5678 [Cymbomonas tetramitiformis]